MMDFGNHLNQSTTRRYQHSIVPFTVSSEALQKRNLSDYRIFLLSDSSSIEARQDLGLWSVLGVPLDNNKYREIDELKEGRWTTILLLTQSITEYLINKSKNAKGKVIEEDIVHIVEVKDLED